LNVSLSFLYLMDSKTIKQIAYQAGADVCGIACTESFQLAPAGFSPVDIFAETKSVIVFGRQFPRGVFLAKSNAPYTLVRNQLIQFVDNLALHLSFEIEKKGGKALPIPSSEPYEYWDAGKRHGRGILSLKHSAQLAGLGCIGKNTLLINGKYGNRLWLGGVLTSIKLEADAVTENYCPDNCRICLESCPRQALNEITIDQQKCRGISHTCTEGGGWLIACNVCRTECPYSGK
jgi:epoxyqueuosine reductase QueG